MSTRRGVALALSVLLLPACASTQVSDSDRYRAQAAYDRALGHLRERQPSPALGALKEAVAVDPNVAVYRDTLGLVYLELGRPDLAIEQLRRAAELDPKLADAHFHLGTAYAESARWEDAVASYRQALAQPTLGIPDLVHQNLGLALYHLKRYPEAESSLRFAQPRSQASGGVLQPGAGPDGREAHPGGPGGVPPGPGAGSREPVRPGRPGAPENPGRPGGKLGQEGSFFLDLIEPCGVQPNPSSVVCFCW